MCRDALSGTLTADGSNRLSFEIGSASGSCESKERLLEDGCSQSIVCGGKGDDDHTVNLSATGKSLTELPDFIEGESEMLFSDSICFGAFSWAASRKP